MLIFITEQILAEMRAWCISAHYMHAHNVQIYIMPWHAAGEHVMYVIAYGMHHADFVAEIIRMYCCVCNLCGVWLQL
jgi:hypothetical protein